MIFDLTFTDKNNDRKSILTVESGEDSWVEIEFKKLPILNLFMIQLGRWEKPQITRTKFTAWTIFCVSVGFASIAGSYDH
jgi:hypothetical protein